MNFKFETNRVKIIENPDSFKTQNSVLTVGTFDGLHLGHRNLLETLCERAKFYNGESVVFTFWPHPRYVINPGDNSLSLLNTLEEKKQLFEKTGIDKLIVFPFTKEFSQLTAEEFIQNYLVERLGIKHLIVGFNHHFGRDRQGDINQLKVFGRRYNFTVEKVEAYYHHELKISSTHIRQLIQFGDVESATELLGYSYLMTGKVIEGNKLGRKINYPTANLLLERFKIIPHTGVYIVDVVYKGKKYQGMMNIGKKPTVNDTQTKTIEVHILDFSQTIYNEELTIFFRKKIRDEIHFESVEHLIAQLRKDENTSRKYYSEHGFC